MVWEEKGYHPPHYRLLLTVAASELSDSNNGALVRSHLLKCEFLPVFFPGKQTKLNARAETYQKWLEANSSPSQRCRPIDRQR